MRVVTVTKRLSHEEVFLERYDRLLKSALQITSSDRELAEDIVHDAFMQFTLSAPNLVAINNADHYLFGVLRHLHLSHLRRATRQRLEQLSTIEWGSTKVWFLGIDPEYRLQVQDELQAVCRYACLRKESSISASVLILRFFHGYYPGEIAKLLHSSRNIVDVHLKFARREAQAFLANPNSCAVVESNFASHPVPSDTANPLPDIFTELRREIFAARRGECFQPEQLLSIYQTGEAALTRATVSHLVSCLRCIDEVNKLLELLPLCERYPIDALGRECDLDREDKSDKGETSTSRPWTSSEVNTRSNFGDPVAEIAI